MAAMERLLPVHCKAISADNSNDITCDPAVSGAFHGQYPQFFNAATAGTINIIDASGIVCNGIQVNAGWNSQPMIRLLTGGTVTSGVAGWAR